MRPGSILFVGVSVHLSPGAVKGLTPNKQHHRNPSQLFLIISLLANRPRSSFFCARSRTLTVRSVLCMETARLDRDPLRAWNDVCGSNVVAVDCRRTAREGCTIMLNI